MICSHLVLLGNDLAMFDDLYELPQNKEKFDTNVKVVTRAEVMNQHHKRDEIEIVLDREGAHPTPYIPTV